MSVIILIVKHPHQDLPLPFSFPPPGLSPWLLSAATNVTRWSHDDHMTSSWSRSSWRHWQWRMLLAHISSQQILGPFAWFAWGIHKTQHDMRILCLSYGLHFPQPTSENFPPQAGASCWEKNRNPVEKKTPRGFPQKQKLKNNKHQATKCPEGLIYFITLCEALSEFLVVPVVRESGASFALGGPIVFHATRILLS